MKLFVLIFIFLGLGANASFIGKSCAEVENYYSKLDSYNLNKKSCEEYEGVWRGQFDNGVVYTLDMKTQNLQELRNFRKVSSLLMSFNVPNEITITRSTPFEFELGRIVDNGFLTTTYATCHNGEKLSVFMCHSGRVVGVVNLNMNRLNQPDAFEKRFGISEKSYAGTAHAEYESPFMTESTVQEHPALLIFKDQTSFSIDVTKD